MLRLLNCAFKLTIAGLKTVHLISTSLFLLISLISIRRHIAFEDVSRAERLKKSYLTYTLYFTKIYIQPKSSKN